MKDNKTIKFLKELDCLMALHGAEIDVDCDCGELSSFHLTIKEEEGNLRTHLPYDLTPSNILFLVDAMEKKITERYELYLELKAEFGDE